MGEYHYHKNHPCISEYVSLIYTFVRYLSANSQLTHNTQTGLAIELKFSEPDTFHVSENILTESMRVERFSARRSLANHELAKVVLFYLGVWQKKTMHMGGASLLTKIHQSQVQIHVGRCCIIIVFF